MGKKKKKYTHISEIFTYNSLAQKRCFLLAGGPSLRNFNYSCLKDEFTIGVNKSFTAFDPVINYSMDLKFYRSVTSKDLYVKNQILQEKWKNYTGYKVFLAPKRIEFFQKDILIVNKQISKVLSLDVAQGVYPGSNSGFGALMLAISMGCKEIYLLGYDLAIVKHKRTHWHEGYGKELDTFAKTLKKFKKDFETFSDVIEENGIKVINLNIKSALTCFHKQTLNSVLKLT